MKKATMIFAAAALLLGGLASCSGNSGKTRVGVLQFGSFEALEKAKQGFVDVLNASDLKGKVDITVKNAAAVGADDVSFAGTLASNSDLLYGIATPSATHLKTAVGSLGVDIPVLFSAVTNPVGAGLLKNPEKPEGNCTGVVDLGPIEDQLEILAKFPDVDNVVTFFNSDEGNSVYQADIVDAWLDEHHIAHSRKTITQASEISSAFASIPSDVDAVFLPTDDTIANSINLIKSANESRMDKLIVVGSDTGMSPGSVFAMGVDYYQCGKQAGQMAVSLLKKEKTVAQLPVESCSTKNLLINQTWANALGIEIPEEVLNIPGAIVQ
ncbi:MAG: ABC transporter substrate-binding protein [Bacilli bacterium]|nr:ABC transporter substrate-binding protein [Bacilli bacterium]